jgi:parvulin-like peptidyl-prolyl isomerase
LGKDGLPQRALFGSLALILKAPFSMDPRSGSAFQVLAMACVLSLSGCKRPEGPDFANAVAVAGDPTISLSQWRAELAHRGNPADAKERDAILRQMIRTELLVQRAQEAGMDKDPEVQQRWRRLLATVYEERFAGKTNATIPSVAVEAYYKEHSADFAMPERWRVSGILVKVPPKATPERRAVIEKQARTLTERIQSAPETLAKLALQNSEDPGTRYRRGDLGWLSEAELATRLGTNAVGLVKNGATNTVFDPIISETSCWIVRLDDHQPSQPKALSAVSDLIQYRLAQTARAKAEAAFEDSLKQGKRVEILPIGQKELNPGAQSPPSLPR